MTEDTAWVIYKLTGEVYKLVVPHYNSYRYFAIMDKKRGEVLLPKADCIPCPEPLPEKYCVQFPNDNGYYTRYNKDGYNGTWKPYEKKFGPIVTKERHDFWHIRVGKEYREKVAESISMGEIRSINKNASAVNEQINKVLSTSINSPIRPDYHTLYEQREKEVGYLEVQLSKKSLECLQEKSLREALEEKVNDLGEQINNCRHYLMGVNAEDVTVENALIALGYNSNGL